MISVFVRKWYTCFSFGLFTCTCVERGLGTNVLVWGSVVALSWTVGATFERIFCRSGDCCRCWLFHTIDLLLLYVGRLNARTVVGLQKEMSIPWRFRACFFFFHSNPCGGCLHLPCGLFWDRNAQYLWSLIYSRTTDTLHRPSEVEIQCRADLRKLQLTVRVTL